VKRVGAGVGGAGWFGTTSVHGREGRPSRLASSVCWLNPVARNRSSTLLRAQPAKSSHSAPNDPVFQSASAFEMSLK
jgi:hypothetical protein